MLKKGGMMMLTMGIQECTLIVQWAGRNGEKRAAKTILDTSSHLKGNKSYIRRCETQTKSSIRKRSKQYLLKV
jgi:hypothetical protein